MDKRICIILLCVMQMALSVTARSISKHSTLPTTKPTINPYRPAAIHQTDPDRQDYRNQPRIIEQFNHRNPDGSYEFRYELSDGNTRYERGYFLNRNNTPSLVVTGYYAYRLDDGRYTTVFYNADHNGYRQQASTTSQGWPDLPRTIDVQDQELVQNVVSSQPILRKKEDQKYNRQKY
ncbi:endocuticle structural glycoprotein SgAbd-1 [Episyrphus balteatus]|uniref:endocuticle structural glycoprotein SgAbd-1 n=1 Tax=Episyrphus balteatus TaxID=286459 RepID=UPI0024854126|nr:endocuticle structural glycoprotein SgAbd-1 [Episyrphus balteatus]XP_055846217.1 endocuticle structural glycoprotein SgAbd-1 [Episyrphus balteatus]